MADPPLEGDLQAGVFRVTRCTAFGPFPGRRDLPAMRARGVTHVLNLAGARSDIDAARDGFREILSRPVSDLARLPQSWLGETFDHMHRMLSEPDSRLFVHCHAGQQRAPTVLWLYLCACGADSGAAASWIRDRSIGAQPGHSALVDSDMLDRAIAHGAARFLPLARPEIVQPV